MGGNLSPCVRAKTLKLLTIFKAVALTGRLADCHYTQGAALGKELLPLQGVLLIWASALTGRAAYMGFCPFMALLLWASCPFQGVLLIWASALSWRYCYGF